MDMIFTEDISEVQARLYAAQRHAATLGGDELKSAAAAAGALAQSGEMELVAADSAGERIVGAASLLYDCIIADTTRRHDGRVLLIVAGMIAGPHGIARTAEIARSAGAAEVHACHLGGWDGPIRGCSTVQLLESVNALT
ncbi:hypothetical protein [Agromyces sp. NPDC058104]|uniref:hypothetical protein n=1 Tax=Agromyces sp. NPDC058104 TaxID=3346342 RepID=UPI0036DBDCF2